MKKGFIIGAAVLLCSALGASIYLRTAFDPKPAEGLDYDDPPTVQNCWLTLRFVKSGLWSLIPYMTCIWDRQRAASALMTKASPSLLSPRENIIPTVTGTPIITWR